MSIHRVGQREGAPNPEGPLLSVHGGECVDEAREHMAAAHHYLTQLLDDLEPFEDSVTVTRAMAHVIGCRGQVRACWDSLSTLGMHFATDTR